MKAEFHVLLCSAAGSKCGVSLSLYLSLSLSLPANTGTASVSELLLITELMTKVLARNGSNLVAGNFLLIFLGKFDQERHRRWCKQHARETMTSRLMIWQICTDTSPILIYQTNGVTCHKTVTFKITALKTPNPTPNTSKLYHYGNFNIFKV